MMSELSRGGAGLPDASKAATAGEAASNDRVNTASTDAEVQPMKHNDLQLHSLLNLARSCLKYERLPGELSERGFFDKFDAEHALAEASKESDDSLTKDSSAASPAPSGPLTMEEAIDATLAHIDGLQKLVAKNDGESAKLLANSAKQIHEIRHGDLNMRPDDDKADVRTLKDQTSHLERIALEAKKALEACTSELRKEVLVRREVEKDEAVAVEECEKARHQLRLGKDMVKRQNAEIKKFHADIQELKVAAATSVQSAPACVPARPSGPGKPKGGRPWPGGRPPGESPTTATAPSAPSGAATTLSSGGAAEQNMSQTLSDSATRPVRAPQPRPPNLAHTIVLPPKCIAKRLPRDPETGAPRSVLPRDPATGVRLDWKTGAPRNNDDWKFYIP